jgi:hypothetical protein
MFETRFSCLKHKNHVSNTKTVFQIRKLCLKHENRVSNTVFVIFNEITYRKGRRGCNSDV